MKEYYVEREPHLLAEHQFEFFLQKNNQSSSYISTAHTHPAIEFIYVDQGSFEIGIGNDTLLAEVGDLVIIRANMIHTFSKSSEGPGEYYVIKVTPSFLFRVFSQKNDNCYVIPFLNNSKNCISRIESAVLPESVRSILQTMIREYIDNDEFFFTAQRIHIAEFILALLRTVIIPAKHNDFVEDINAKNVEMIYKCVQYINDNYASDISPDDCAASIHISYSYFAKLFRTVMGRTFKEYLTDIRLAKARNILISTDISVTDVAASCGYTNLSYFISEYRRVYGKTPRDTRKELSIK